MTERGKKYKTVGGWEALVVYVSFNKSVFWAVHAPDTPNESAPIPHKSNGETLQNFAFPPFPRYDKLFPSDVLVNEEIK